MGIITHKFPYSKVYLFLVLSISNAVFCALEVVFLCSAKHEPPPTGELQSPSFAKALCFSEAETIACKSIAKE